MYIAIEGIDTAGKSTQIQALSKTYPNAIVTKEPGATIVGKKIRQIALAGEAENKKTEFLLFLADRAEHIQEVVKPNIANMIISDRSAVSGVAYALVQKNITEDELVFLNNFATDGVYPDVVFLLKLSKTELEHRLSQKRLDGIELRGSNYLMNIQDSMIQASKLLGIRLIEIDATLSIEAITHNILNNIKDMND